MCLAFFFVPGGFLCFYYLTELPCRFRVSLGEEGSSGPARIFFFLADITLNRAKPPDSRCE